MTKLVFNKSHLYDCSTVTRDSAPSFIADGHSMTLKPVIVDGVVLTRVHVYKGRYNGLNREITHYDLKVSPEILLFDILKKDASIELHFGSAEDYFGQVRAKEIRVEEPSRQQMDSVQAG